MTNPVDTLKAALSVLRQDDAPYLARATALRDADAAIAALSGGEAVAWRIQWSEAIPGDYELTYSRKRVEGCLALDNPPRIEPLYTTPRIPAGMVLVPREPTGEMLLAINCLLPSNYTGADCRDIYRAMLAAAPGDAATTGQVPEGMAFKPVAPHAAAAPSPSLRLDVVATDGCKASLPTATPPAAPREE